MEQSVFDRVGGWGFFERLVEGFYVGVAADPILRPMYPEDLEDSRRHLVLFLAQYWGGPREYEELRGHPRLRMRHQPFAVTRQARDAWLAAMMHSLDALRPEIGEDVYREMSDYFTMSARQLRNV